MEIGKAHDLGATLSVFGHRIPEIAPVAMNVAKYCKSHNPYQNQSKAIAQLFIQKFLNFFPGYLLHKTIS